MQRSYLYIVFFTLLGQISVFAQLQAIQELDEVVLTDSRLIYFSEGFKLERLQDTVIKRNSTSLTEALRFNSSIYFKENGLGMVSSPSFRGTNAAQTAVIWNGININSIFTGQTDFNTISPLSYDEITIRSGGGGVQYGSGAVGGSIHLNNDFSFTAKDSTSLGLRFGSFSTLGGSLETTKTWKNHYLNVGVDFIHSENDYDYVGKNKKNQHGQFLRFNAHINEARKLKYGTASWHSEYTYNDRNFSGSLNTNGKDGYKDVASRNLLKLSVDRGIFKNDLSAAHIFELFQYYPHTERPDFSQGRAHTLLGAIQSEVLLNRNLRLNGKLEYSTTDAEGDNIGQHNRNTLAVVVLMNHKIFENFNYGLNLRKEFLNGFGNPWLFSADSKWEVTRNYSLRLNGSKNYRVPTFNDLYWYAGGNYELRPETSYQIELGQVFELKGLKVDVAGYYITSKNLIKWVPGNGGLWKPSNISESRNYGVEVSADYSLFFNRNHRIEIRTNYSYTKAEDMEKRMQLIYVPYHKATGLMEYQYKQFSTYLQGIYTGMVFTTTDNSDSVEDSSVFNFDGAYGISAKKNIILGAQINNIFNVYYENVAYRPMPGRNFQINLNFNI